MWLVAQAVAEYGGLTSSRTASGTFDSVVDRVANASGTDYLLAIAALIVVMYVISKLLDAA